MHGNGIEKYETNNDGERCMSELTSLKYQLAVVTEYKNHIDKLLTETIKKNNDDKEQFKDIIENCIAMKQQAAICQVNINKMCKNLQNNSQFEDLQGACRSVKEKYDILIKGMENVKLPS
ncbi:unnamed protein product [Leptidea sinapis]|uniref:Uncharacterized protein n=1 Tax=Leptidea sinapis TaxID=189913 RepID=A0A5E4QR86_9NEOP|nr:unnamed protein product [Leptidea sinapis]